MIDEEKENPYIYSGSEIDKQGSKGVARIQKLNGLDGRVMWEKKIPGFSLLGDSPVNGGVLGTPIIGEGPLKGQVIYNISRFKTFNGGLLISLDKETGEEVWRWEMPNYSWSSTVAVYTDNGKAYFVQADSVGNIFLLNESGKTLLFRAPPVACVGAPKLPLNLCRVGKWHLSFALGANWHLCGKGGRPQKKRPPQGCRAAIKRRLGYRLRANIPYGNIPYPVNPAALIIPRRRQPDRLSLSCVRARVAGCSSRANHRMAGSYIHRSDSAAHST